MVVLVKTSNEVGPVGMPFDNFLEMVVICWHTLQMASTCYQPKARWGSLPEIGKIQARGDSAFGGEVGQEEEF